MGSRFLRICWKIQFSQAAMQKAWLAAHAQRGLVSKNRLFDLAQTLERRSQMEMRFRKMMNQADGLQSLFNCAFRFAEFQMYASQSIKRRRVFWFDLQ